MYVSILLIVLFGSLLAFKFHVLGREVVLGVDRDPRRDDRADDRDGQAVLRQGEGGLSASALRRAAVSDEELGDVLTSPRAHLISAIGVIGLLAILYLMIFKPF